MSDQKPVAWIRQRDNRLALSDGGVFGDDWTPLYTHPPQPDTEMPKTICGPNLEEVLNAAGFFKRKPLTVAEMQKLMDEEALWQFARAIEKAHGIR
jgi:hypothetical protein